jgi:deaminated glutathione amidase
MKISVIQMAFTNNLVDNLASAKALMTHAMAEDRPDWILLPEHFPGAGATLADRIASAEEFGSGPAYSLCCKFARENQVFVHAGSIYERADRGRLYNTSVAFNRAGREVARYRKIHLFDVTTPGGAKYCESDTVGRGNEVVTYDAEGFTVGCAICYDLRFPELFQALVRQGANLIALPAAFTLQTGKDHWGPLLQARAIESQAYIAASAQFGTSQMDGRAHTTYGHSLVADPWGHVVAMASDGPGFITARLDPALVGRVREQIPLAEHRCQRDDVLNEVKLEATVVHRR